MRILRGLSALLLCLPAGLMADDVIHESANGGINWSQGLVYAIGYGTARADASSAQKRILAERAAVVDAQRNLLEMTKGVRISSVLRTDQAMAKSRTTATRVEGIIKGAQVTRRHYHNDVATITMSMPIGGKFMQAVLPGADILTTQHHGRQFNLTGRLPQQASTSGLFPELMALLIPRAQAEETLVIREQADADAYRRLLEWMNKAPAADIKVMLGEALQRYETNSQFSGLLIDASGVPQFELATVPRIRDQDGNVVYPSEQTSYEDIINKRGVTYDFDLNDAIRNQRVATTPFIIKALTTYESLPSDLVIETSDAERVQQSASTLDAMNRAGVLIVVAL